MEVNELNKAGMEPQDKASNNDSNNTVNESEMQKSASENKLQDIDKITDDVKSDNLETDESLTEESSTDKALTEENSDVSTLEPVNEENADNKEEKTEVVVEDSNKSETQDDEENKEPIKPEEVDISTLDKVGIIDRMRHLLNNFNLMVIKDEAEQLRVAFYKIYNEEVEAIKQKFIDSGEKEMNFIAPADELEKEFKLLVKEFKTLKSNYTKQIEAEKEVNLAKKLEVIEEIKGLVNRQESINDTFVEFRELQKRFHEIGNIPQSKVRDVWDTYHLHVENFYDYVKINRDLRDLDLKKNMEAKILLCERAEELQEGKNAVEDFKKLQELHARWREIGPVPKDKREELWQRFSQASSVINQRHHKYYENLHNILVDNLKRKTELCEKVEAILEDLSTSARSWEKQTKEIVEIQKVWKTIGFAPKKENTTIYERFRLACDSFFDKKREFFKQYKINQQNNLEKKIKLCEKAEALADSTEWRKTTDILIALQKEWKTIGPVPYKVSDSIWARFRKPCDIFFENKAKHFHNIENVYDTNLKAKKDLIQEVTDYKLSEDNDLIFKDLQEFQRRFAEIGHVPYKFKDSINNEFRNAINKHFDNLNMDEYHKNIERYKNRLANMVANDKNDKNDKLYSERNKLMNKLKQIENDITVWENNIGFFAKSKNSESVLRDFKRKIENGKRDIKLLNEKLKMLNNLD